MLKFVANFICFGLVLYENTILNVYRVSNRISNLLAVSSDWHPRIENDIFILRVAKSNLTTRRPRLAGAILSLGPAGQLFPMVCGNSPEFHPLLFLFQIKKQQLLSISTEKLLL